MTNEKWCLETRTGRQFSPLTKFLRNNQYYKTDSNELIVKSLIFITKKNETPTVYCDSLEEGY